MTMTRILLAQDVNGQAEATGSGTTILIDVDLATFATRCGPPEQGMAALPLEWQQRAQRRVREAQAASGATSATGVLMHLAREKWGAAVDFDLDIDAGSLWLLTKDAAVIRFVSGGDDLP